MTSHEFPQSSCSLFLSLTSTGKPCPESLQLPAVPLSLVKKTVFSGTNWSFAGFTTDYYKSASLSPIPQQIACPPTSLRKSKPRPPSVSHRPSLINIFRFSGTLLSLWSPGSKDGLSLFGVSLSSWASVLVSVSPTSLKFLFLYCIS